MNRASLLNDEWSFWLDEQCRTELPAQQVEWQPVTLPHDWQIWHVSNLYQDGTGWYRRTLVDPPREGQRVALYFEGVYMDTTVFVNGAVAGEWKNGYTSFHLDVTELLRPGENELLVRCLLRHPNSRWYSGAGIYRDVWLWEMPTEHLLPHSLYVAPKEQPDGAWTVSVQVELGCSDGQGDYDGAEVLFLLRDPSGAELDRHVLPAGRGTPVSAEDAADYAQGERNILAVRDTFRLERPALWDVDAPCCYRMEARLRRGGVTDRIESTFGCRTVELDSKRGLLLNHRPPTLHGVCLHHDLGCLGSAFSQAAAERQLRIMKEMGANALRTAHNPPAEGVMELADRYGMLVVSEAFDVWNIPKNPYDYARFFPAWEARDVASWVRRDRNHPSLLLWSIGNEIYDTHAGPEGLETMRRLMSQVQAQDHWGNGAVTLGSNYMAWENTQRCAEELPAVGYNYGEALYAAHHATHPDWVIYGSETGSLVQSRGIYHFPLCQSVLVDDDQQCSSLGNSRTSWGGPTAWKPACGRAWSTPTPWASSCGAALTTSGNRPLITQKTPTSARWTPQDSQKIPITTIRPGGTTTTQSLCSTSCPTGTGTRGSASTSASTPTPRRWSFGSTASARAAGRRRRVGPRPGRRPIPPVWWRLRPTTRWAGRSPGQKNTPSGTAPLCGWRRTPPR